MSKKKICFASSSGGHFEQLMMLKPLMNDNDSFILTEKTIYEIDTKDINTYFVKQVNRKEKKVLLLMVYNVIKSLMVFLKEKPDVVISTGALSTLPICFISKILKKKIIYIESFAKVTSPTKSGKLMYKYADQFYIQWDSMKKIYPKGIYVGGIY